jgi:hypothetical protein
LLRQEVICDERGENQRRGSCKPGFVSAGTNRFYLW